METKEKSLLKQEVLRQYLQSKSKQEEANGGYIFMSIPDRWYDKLTFVCENGHLASRYLKSEALFDNVCFSCKQHIFICPPETTEQEILDLLANAN